MNALDAIVLIAAYVVVGVAVAFVLWELIYGSIDLYRIKRRITNYLWARRLVRRRSGRIGS